ncbi:YbhB/YbcL family Raf kinase inhibitor-like protein [Pyrodictium abyssi]|uniref:YbhB/YbcL family Raf kinase inhibitor-like protein n=1 Tax=Pyrodictium abyssi TaxID=54256 RepID=A0ABM8IUI8_9CREN|nr:hypothetical protein PABY_07990 [Pyrodictium abyssi]
MAQRHTVKAIILAASIAVAVAAAIYTSKNPHEARPVPLPDLVAGAPESITVSSPAFPRGGTIPAKYTCDGADVSPPLAIENVPAQARSLLLLVYDPDAPGGVFVHWVLYDVPRGLSALPEGVPRDPAVEGLGLQGRNGFGKTGYNGPCPPRGDRPHRYVFLVIALDVESLGLEPGSPWSAVLDRASGHVVAYGYTYGVYARQG